MNYRPTIGLEIHAELSTQSKMFCDCKNDPMEIDPNTNVCPICMAHPGTLPKANREAIEMVLKTGLALNCQINKLSKFDRKNYFYPDLPKAYQISQYDKPFCLDGFLILPSSGKKIRITRIHLEEDTGKLCHAGDGKHSLVDFNRAGVPLMELVTEPDFSLAQDVVEFAHEFQLILRYLGVSDGDMEKGHLRIEANTSVAKDGDPLGTKVEVKNLNSFKAVFGAINYEIERQSERLTEGETIKQETRGWDETKGETFSQRSKEEAHDYRYFPEPDLPPFTFSDQYLKEVRAKISELPKQKRDRLSSQFNLSDLQRDVLINDMYISDFFEEAVSEFKSLNDSGDIDLIFNYLTSDLKGVESERGILISQSGFKPIFLAQIADMITKEKISSRVAKDVLIKSFDTGESPENIVKNEGLTQISDELEIETVVQSVIDDNQKVWYDYKNGKESAVQFLIGQVMAKTKGKSNPAVVKNIFGKLSK
ncbi:MAG: Asp-tRNA(Asn)/Glu-tRNA(Gln) amidotransferase subunit GatB [Candidatus Paceibacterota bacterium]|jgi:aspartyl-tRNA(Asn)/glutamyl-tRNA(Gln) amidotransferase subunit B